MKALIIDASAAPVRDYLARYGTTDGMIYAAWYRVLRPALIALMWVMFALYIHHSLVTVGGTAAEIAELAVYVGVVASMAALLVSWMIVWGFHDWIRMRDQSEAQDLYRPEKAYRPPVWAPPPDARRLLVHHDNKGRIVAVEPWQIGGELPDDEPVFYISRD